MANQRIEILPFPTDAGARVQPPGGGRARTVPPGTILEVGDNGDISKEGARSLLYGGAEPQARIVDKAEPSRRGPGRPRKPREDV